MKTDLNPDDKIKYFSQFEKCNNGTEIPFLEIEEIVAVPYLLDYLRLNPAIKKLNIKICSQYNQALRLLTLENNTLTYLFFYALGNDKEEDLDQGLVDLKSNQSLTELHLIAWSFSLQRITQLLTNKVLKTLELKSYDKKHYEIDPILSNNPNLKKLIISDTVISSDCYSLANADLNTLDLSHNFNLGDEGVGILSSSSSLTDLNLLGCGDIGDAKVASLLELKSLKVLNLTYHPIGDKGIESISQHPNITGLTLRSFHISYQGIELLLQRKKHVLQSFHFTGPLKEEKDKSIGHNLVDLFSDCSALTHLTLKNCGIGPDEAASISKIQNLEHLDLSENPLGNKGAYYLSTLTRINSLYLQKCNINDSGVIVLASNLCLNRLVLDGNKFRIVGLIALAFNRTTTEICFDYEYKPICDLAWLFLLGNQTLRYFMMDFFPQYRYTRLIQLGGRNFRLQKQYVTDVVNPELCKFNFLPKDIIKMVLDYAKPAYPYRFGLFRKELTKEICDKMEGRMRNALPELKQYFIDLKNGGLFWNDLQPEARSQMHQMFPQIEQNFIDIENELTGPSI